MLDCHEVEGTYNHLRSDPVLMGKSAITKHTLTENHLPPPPIPNTYPFMIHSLLINTLQLVGEGHLEHCKPHQLKELITWAWNNL